MVERVQKGSSGRLLSFLSTLICFLRGAGIGVIISTALVHLINEAYDYFGEEGERHPYMRPRREGWRTDFNKGCNWEEITGYDAWPMVFAMAGMWLISLMEFAHLRLDAMQAKEAGGPAVRESMHAVQLSVRGASAEIDPEEAPDKPAPLVEPMTKYGRTAILVELSILIHSVIVGFDLGLQDVSSWRTLVVAIAFHQFFEGFALGQVILEASFRPLKNWLMIAFFSLTTSVGIAIGIGTSLSPSWEGESPAVAATIGESDDEDDGMRRSWGLRLTHISLSLSLFLCPIARYPQLFLRWHPPLHGHVDLLDRVGHCEQGPSGGRVVVSSHADFLRSAGRHDDHGGYRNLGVSLCDGAVARRGVPSPR